MSVPRGPAADDLVLRRAGRAAIVAGNRIDDTTDMLKHALDTPEAPTGEDERLRAGPLRRLIHPRSGQLSVEIGALGIGATEGAQQVEAEEDGRRNGRHA